MALTWGSIFSGFPPLGWNQILDLTTSELGIYAEHLDRLRKAERKRWEGFLKTIARSGGRRLL